MVDDSVPDPNSELAELVDHVIGVDTHNHTNIAAIVTATTAAVIETTAAGTDPAGDQCLLDLAERSDGLRARAIEGESPWDGRRLSSRAH